LKVNSLLLRYIDAIEFDFKKSNVLEFLNTHLKMQISLDTRLFKSTEVEDTPSNFDFRFAFRSSRPKGEIHLRFGRGNRKGIDALVWETMVRSDSQNVPENVQMSIREWLTEGHNLTDDWFFKLIEGELLRRFE